MPSIVASVNKVTHQATKTGIRISSFMRKPKLSLDINAANAYDGISAPHRCLRWRLVQAGKSQLGELGNIESAGESLPCELRGAQTNNAGIRVPQIETIFASVILSINKGPLALLSSPGMTVVLFRPAYIYFPAITLNPPYSPLVTEIKHSARHGYPPISETVAGVARVVLLQRHAK